MAFDEYLANRVTQYFTSQRVVFYSKIMFGGLVFMVDDKMCCGVMKNKTTGLNQLMCRISPEEAEQLIGEKICESLDFTGVSMKGFVLVQEAELDFEEQLQFWLDLCLHFNPLAKRTIKKLKK